MNINPDAIRAAVDATIGDRIINGDRMSDAMIRAYRKRSMYDMMTDPWWLRPVHTVQPITSAIPLTMTPPSPTLLGYNET